MDTTWIIQRPQALRGLGMEFQVMGVVRDTMLTANNLHVLFIHLYLLGTGHSL